MIGSRARRLRRLFSIFRFSLLKNGLARARNAEVDALVGHESALTPPDRTPEGTFRTRGIAVEQGGR